jgi:hypothetical protein
MEIVVVTPLLQLVQARFLRELFRASKGGFVLKGGMAVAALYGTSRQTRDIDLDFPPLDKRTAESLHNQVRRALDHALRGYVVDVKIHSPGKGEISPKWKVSGRSADGAPFNLKVEVSRRAPPPGSIRQVTVSGITALGLGVFYVDLYSEPTLAAMKIAALLSPDRCAPRDVYDLDLLLPVNQPGRELLEWALDVAHVAPIDASQVLREKLEAMPWDLFQTQTLPAIEPTTASRYTADTWKEMKDRVTGSLTPLFETHALELLETKP